MSDATRSTSEPRYYLSPVDYEAWREGYLPPSEHLLIHELQFGGAKVCASSSIVRGEAWWIVWKGRRPSAKALQAAFEIMSEIADEGAPTSTTGPDDASGMNLEHDTTGGRDGE